MIKPSVSSREVIERILKQRFTHSTDHIGNVTLLDTKTSRTKWLQGEEASSFLEDVTKHPDKDQGIIEKYF